MSDLDSIAAKAGVTKMTVSRALRGVGYVKAETRERILAIASELRYQPNAAAQAMSTGRFGTIALIMGSHNSPIIRKSRTMAWQRVWHSGNRK